MNFDHYLFFSDGYGVYLAEITVDQRLDLPLRQLASVMLKQYVEQSWVLDEDSEDLLKPVASDQAKKVIKSILPEALYDPNSKVRTLKLRKIYSFYSFGISFLFRFAVVLLIQFQQLPVMIGQIIGVSFLKLL